MEACTLGRGELLLSATDAGVPIAAAVSEAVGELPADQVLLTPHSEDAPHPLGSNLAAQGFYRSTDDLRSFNMVVPPLPGAASSLTIKGGDLPWMHEAAEQGHPPAKWRVRQEQIPGAALVEEAQTEFNMAAHMQRTAMSALGRITFTAIPLRVSKIDAIRARDGRLLELRDYLNLPSEYFDLSESERKNHMKMEPAMGMGDLLIGRFGLQAAQYIYATPYLNVRVADLAGNRYIRAFDAPKDDRHENVWWQYFEDPALYRWAHRGDGIPNAPGRKNTILRRVYGLLGEAYGFDANAVLPSRPITDKNYTKELVKIPARCEGEGVAKRVLSGFINRLTEAAASLHAQQMTFSPGDWEGSGSLQPRNVTYAGVVLDLSTAGKFSREPEDHIGQDYAELTFSVAVMRRLVSGQPQPDLAASIQASYLENLAQFGADKSWTARIEQAISSDKVRTETNAIF